MTDTTGQILKGVVINRENLTTPGTFDLKIGRITDVQVPQETAETQDVTTADSPDDFREYIVSLLDGGEASFGYIFDPADGGQVQLKTDFRGRVCAKYQISLPPVGAHAATNVQFSAWITALSPPSGSIEETMKGSVTLKVTGAPT